MSKILYYVPLSLGLPRKSYDFPSISLHFIRVCSDVTRFFLGFYKTSRVIPKNYYGIIKESRSSYEFTCDFLGILGKHGS